MQFFENPRLVTALVFFIQTILVLLQMETLLYMHIFIVFLIPVFFLFPFAFYYVYKFILTDLDKEEIDVTGKPVEEVQKEEMMMHEIESPSPSVEKQEVVQPVVETIPEERPETKPAKSQTRAEKHIQVVHASDVFTDEDPESVEMQEQPPLKPIVVKKAKTTRPKQKAQASKEAKNLNKEKTVKEVTLPKVDEPDEEKEA